jgi:hypothetical protein
VILFILGFLLSISFWIPKGHISHWTIVFDAFIKACLAFSTAVYVGTEILSLFNALNTQNLWIAYGLACLLMGRRAWTTYQQTQFPPLPKLPKLSVGMLVLLGILLAEALYFPPNNYDSMSYHMARVAHWAQNGNVDFYPTGIARQLFSSPLAEYLILHSYLLQGSDLWANSFQWAALVINLLLIVRIIGHMGGHRIQQGLGILVYLLNPMVIFQSTTTQNDLIAGFFVLASFYFLLEHKNKNNTLWLALAISLGALVKFTSLLFVLPLLLFHLSYLRKNIVPKILISLPIALLILGPFLGRNQQTFGHVLGPKPDSPMHIAVTNGKLSPAITYSNTLRTWATDWALPLGPWNQAVNAVVHQLHAVWGLPDNPVEGTYDAYVFNSMFGYTEDTAGNIVGSLLFLLAIAYGIKYRKSIPHVGFLLGISLLGFVLFCSFIRYNPMLARLLVGLYGIQAISIGYILGKFIPRAKAKYLIILFILPWPWLFINKSKPILVAENLIRRWQHVPQQQLSKTDWQKILRSPWYLELTTYYEKQGDQYRIKADLSESQRARIVDILLDSVQLQARPAAWQLTREANYFQNKLVNRGPYAEIRKRIQAKGYTRIGMAWGYDGMEYPWWVMMPGKHLVDVHADPSLAHTRNARTEWVECVISDLPSLGPGWGLYHVEAIGPMYFIEFPKAVQVP